MLSDDFNWCLSCLVNEFLLLLDLEPGLESEYIPAALHSLVERTFASFFASGGAAIDGAAAEIRLRLMWTESE